MTEYENVFITYYVSPYMFWFKLNESSEFIKFDLELQKYFLSGGQKYRSIDELKNDDDIAFYNEKYTKFMRGIVLQTNNVVEEVIPTIWALDFGFPVHNVKLNKIYRLPEKFISERPAAQYASLYDLVPAMREFDPESVKIDVIRTNKWSPEAIELMDKIIKAGKNMNFIMELENHKTDQFFGNLLVFNHNDLAIDVRAMLLDMKFCVASEDFQSDVKKLWTARRLELHDSAETDRNALIEKYFSKRVKKEVRNIPQTSSSTSTEKDCDKPLPFTELMIKLEANLKILSVKPKTSAVKKQVSLVRSRLTKLKEYQKKYGADAWLQQQLIDSLMNEEPSTSESSEFKGNFVSESSALSSSSNSERGQAIATPSTMKLESEQPKRPLIEVISSTSAQDVKKVEAPASTVSESRSSSRSTLARIRQLQKLRQPVNKPVAETLEITESITPVEGNNIGRDNHHFLGKTEIENGTGTTTPTMTNGEQKENVPQSNIVATKRDSNLKKTSVPYTTRSIDLRKNLKEFKKNIGSQYIRKPRVHISPTASLSNEQPIESPSNADTTIISPTTAPDYQGMMAAHPENLNVKSVRLAAAVTESQQSNDFFHREQKAVVLVHMPDNKQPKSITSVEHANFSTSMIRAMDRVGIKSIYRLQAYAWRHIMRNNSIVMVGQKRTGKTTAYLPPLMDLIMTTRDDGLIPDTRGPVALIIVPTANEAITVTDLCDRFNSHLPRRLRIISAYGMLQHKKLLTQFYNGMDILVITPGCLQRVLEIEKNFIEKDRCKYVVLENYQQMMATKKNVLINVLKNVLIKDSSCGVFEQQVIVTSTIWYNLFLDMIKSISAPMLCISSYIEAAYYGKHSFRFILTKQMEKLARLLDQLSDRAFLLEHTVVICTSDVEVEMIVDYLREAQIVCIGCLNKADSIDEIKLAGSWNLSKDTNLSIIVCTDSVLGELHLDNVKHIVHFSLPDKWSKFAYRFSIVFNSITNILVKNPENITPTSSVVMIDETNNTQLPRLIEFLEMHGFSNIQSNIKAAARINRQLREEIKLKESVMLCETFLDFGNCPIQYECGYRHVFNKDESFVLPVDIKNFIKMKIHSVHSPTHFSVEVLGTRNSPKEKWIEFERASYNAFSLKFKVYYAQRENHANHSPTKIGDLCVFESFGKYFRARILDVKKRESIGISVPDVIIKLIDRGDEVKTRSTLLYLPEDLQRQPPRTVDIRLGGIVPVDSEMTWDPEVKNVVKSWVKQYREDSKKNYFVAAVSFKAHDTIWVDSLNVIEDLLKFGGEFNALSIRASLIRYKYCDADVANFDRLKELAMQSGLELTDVAPQSDADLGTFEEPTGVEVDNPGDENDLQKPEDVEDIVVEDINQPPGEIRIDKNFYGDDGGKSFDTKVVPNETAPSDSSFEFDRISDTFEISQGSLSGGWQTLDDGLIEVHMRHFIDPHQFFIQKKSSMRSIYYLQSKINELIENNAESLEETDVGTPCLALQDNLYWRGIVYEPVDENNMVKVLLVDGGGIFRFKFDTLKKSSEELVALKCESVQCSMFGVKRQPDQLWTFKTMDEVYYKAIDSFPKYYLKKVRLMKTCLLTTYEVLLIGVNKEWRSFDIINSTVISLGYGAYDAEGKIEFDALLKSVSDQVEVEILGPKPPGMGMIDKKKAPESTAPLLDCDSDDSSNICMDDDELKEIFLKMMGIEKEELEDAEKKLKAEKEKINQERKVTEVVSKKAVKKRLPRRKNLNATPLDSDDLSDTGVDTSTNNQSIEEIEDTSMPLLVTANNYPAPQTIWQQTRDHVFIKVNVTDHKYWSMDVHQGVVIVLIEFAEEFRRELCINLFGAIEVERTEVKLRGNYLIIALLKSIRINSLWPTLLSQNKKYNWLKYNLESINCESDDDDNDIQRLNVNRNSFDSNDSDVSSMAESDDSLDPLSTNFNFEETRMFRGVSVDEDEDFTTE